MTNRFRVRVFYAFQAFVLSCIPAFAQNDQLWNTLDAGQKYVVILSMAQGFDVAAYMVEHAGDSGATSKRLVQSGNVFGKYDPTRRDGFVTYGVAFFDQFYLDRKNSTSNFGDAYLKLLVSWLKMTQ